MLHFLSNCRHFLPIRSGHFWSYCFSVELLSVNVELTFCQYDDWVISPRTLVLIFGPQCSVTRLSQWTQPTWRINTTNYVDVLIYIADTFEASNTFLGLRNISTNCGEGPSPIKILDLAINVGHGFDSCLSLGFFQLIMWYYRSYTHSSKIPFIETKVTFIE